MHVVAKRQARPNLPSSGCPFCPGGLEAPEPYDVFWFRNRWPAMPGDRCEVVLYTTEHDATFASLGVAGVRKVIDLWADRTAALGSRDDVEFVLVFENRGAEVGATIAHPHGQIYAYDHVPERPGDAVARVATRADPGERLVGEHGDWRAWSRSRPRSRSPSTLAPRHRVADLGVARRHRSRRLAALLVDVLAHGSTGCSSEPMPYMMWLNQRPSDAARHGRTRGSTSRSSRRGARAGVPRFIAAAEVACEEYFNPVVPEDVAMRLREVEHGGAG